MRTNQSSGDISESFSNSRSACQIGWKLRGLTEIFPIFFFPGQSNLQLHFLRRMANRANVFPVPLIVTYICSVKGQFSSLTNGHSSTPKDESSHKNSGSTETASSLRSCSSFPLSPRCFLMSQPPPTRLSLSLWLLIKEAMLNFHGVFQGRPNLGLCRFRTRAGD